jgi:hypothetical protein
MLESAKSTVSDIQRYSMTNSLKLRLETVEITLSFFECKSVAEDMRSTQWKLVGMISMDVDFWEVKCSGNTKSHATDGKCSKIR